LLMELRVHQVMGLGGGMVRMVLVRRGLKARIEPIGKTEEQRVAEEIAARIQQAFEAAFPGGLVISGPIPAGRAMGREGRYGDNRGGIREAGQAEHKRYHNYRDQQIRGLIRPGARAAKIFIPPSMDLSIAEGEAEVGRWPSRAQPDPRGDGEHPAEDPRDPIPGRRVFKAGWGPVEVTPSAPTKF
jgi:hypothetical protein